nr:TIGR02530 family flagellar biosynthesis protein [Metalysinibacillus jejuensis]
MRNMAIQHLPLQVTIPAPKKNIAKTADSSFIAHLERASAQQLKLSKHASERLAQRQITITEGEWHNVSTKVQEASLKGVKNPLVLMEQAALIISAKNSTVITAMDRTEAKAQIFTNIDGTIVL